MNGVSKQDQQKNVRYHHGDLRSALITAAQDILRDKGIEGLSLRALAKATGVTQAAPYSHFRDKEELLAAVAETGFQRLALQMVEDATGFRSARERIERLAISYVRFAQKNTPLFRLMFGRELAEMKKHPTLAMTAGKSYALISSALSTRTSTEVETRFLTVSIWSLCLGLATLIIDEKLEPEKFGSDTVDDFVVKSMAIFSAHLD